LKTYDYAIVGAGAAGLQLALKMVQDAFFEDKQILIIEKDEKDTNDRTWCFWEKGQTIWDELATHIWQKGLFINTSKTVPFDLAPYRYKMVRSKAFYSHAKEELSTHKNVTWAKGEARRIDGQSILTESKTYEANHIFDSRIDPAFNEQKSNYHSLIQHFKGWYIKTKDSFFDPATFTMMDYRLKWNDSTSFTYVLPISDKEALVEFTLFNDELIEDDTYDQFLRKYISDYLKLDDYEVIEEEQGIIPMSDYPFHKHHSQYVTKIGTAGGWVRPSSGYSFKNADRYSSMIVSNIKKGVRPEKGIANSRFRTYDSIFLNVLESRNDLGEEIFTRLYTKPSIQSVFRFLDEESTIIEDLQVMFALNKPQFRKAFISTIRK